MSLQGSEGLGWVSKLLCQYLPPSRSRVEFIVWSTIFAIFLVLSLLPVVGMAAVTTTIVIFLSLAVLLGKARREAVMPRSDAAYYETKGKEFREDMAFLTPEQSAAIPDLQIAY